jgi:hypothetical protein
MMIFPSLSMYWYSLPFLTGTKETSCEALSPQDTSSKLRKNKEDRLKKFFMGLDLKVK